MVQCLATIKVPGKLAGHSRVCCVDMFWFVRSQEEDILQRLQLVGLKGRLTFKSERCQLQGSRHPAQGDARQVQHYPEPQEDWNINTQKDHYSTLPI